MVKEKIELEVTLPYAPLRNKLPQIKAYLEWQAYEYVSFVTTGKHAIAADQAVRAALGLEKD